jgi:hypothetical protein
VLLIKLGEIRGNLIAFTLFLPLLATGLIQAADSCSITESVNRLVEVDGAYYSINDWQSLLDADVGGQAISQYNPVSNRWERIDELPESGVPTITESHELPLTKCLPNDASICYRIEGDQRVLTSEDGGNNWKTAWSLPAGRVLFMDRANICTGRINLGPFDLLLAEKPEGHEVVVALGEEGVVFRDADGSWERQTVLNASPTPYRATTLLEILVTIPTEFGGWLLFVIIYGIGQYIFFLRRLRYIFPPITTAFLIFMTGVLMLAYRMLDSGSVIEWGWFFLIIVTYVGPIYLAYRKWVGESYKLDKPEKSEEAARYWLWSTLALLFGGILLLTLWPVGLIPFYLLMVILVLGTAVTVAWWGSTRISLLMSEAGRWH